MICSIKYTRGIDDYYLYFNSNSNNFYFNKNSNNYEDCKKAFKEVCHHICEIQQINKETQNSYTFISDNTKLIKNEMAKRGFKPLSVTEIAEFSDEEPLSEAFQYNDI